MKSKKPIVVSYWWETFESFDTYDFIRNKTITNTYKKMARDFETNMHKLHMDVHVECIQASLKGKQQNINYKPLFILRMMKKFPKRPIIYMDIDMRLHKPPLLFTKTNGFYDYMAFNWNAEPRVSSKFDWNTLETSGGLQYFNNTPRAKRLLRLWAKELQKPKYKHKADDRILAMVFKNTLAYTWLRFYWIPLEYFFVPQYFKGKVATNNIVISHPYQMTNENKTINRVPIGYNVQVTQQIQPFPYIIESEYNKFNIFKQVTKSRNNAFHIPYKTKIANDSIIYDISLWSNYIINLT